MLHRSGEPDEQTYHLPEDNVILDRIRAFVADAADIGVESVGADDDIYAELGVDSLGSTAIFIDISYEFHVPEPGHDTDFQTLNTPRKLLSYVKTNFGPRVGTSKQSDRSVGSDISKIDVTEILPYGKAFRLVDTVLFHETGRLITSTTWSTEDPMIEAHFENGPHIVPAVLLIEQVAQSALILANLDGYVSAEDLLILGQIRCDVRAPVVAPASTTAEVTFQAGIGENFGFLGICASGEKEVARVRGIATRPVALA